MISSARPHLEMPDQVKAEIIKKLIALEKKGAIRERRVVMGMGNFRKLIAICILIVCGILFVQYLPNSARANELLEEIAAINGRYIGWVHIKPDNVPEFQDSFDQKLESLVLHVNPAENIAVSVMNFKDTTRVHWNSESDDMKYDGRTNQLRISPGTFKDEDVMFQETDALTPWHVAQNLFMQPTFDALVNLIKYAKEVHYVKEDSYERFDVTFGKAIDSGSGEDSSTLSSPANLVIWVDPESKLIQECEIEVIENEHVVSLLLTFSYDEPAIQDIYDLGVPLTASVVDNRPGADLAPILGRLENRVVQGFGNYTAVLTESIVTKDQNLKEKALSLFAQKDNASLYTRYPLSKSSPISEKMIIEKWPIPAIDDILSQAKDGVLPEIFFVSNGLKASHGMYEKTSASYRGLGEIVDGNKIDLNTIRFGLSAKVWPSQYNIGFDRREFEEKVTLLHDENRPQEIGLHFESTSSESTVAGGGIGRIETICWIDPARDDLIVEKDEKFYSPDSKTINFEQHTQYIDYSQINGQWYPTCWQTTFTHFSDGKLMPNATIEYNLFIYSDITLDDWWFTDIADNFKM